MGNPGRLRCSAPQNGPQTAPAFGSWDPGGRASLLFAETRLASTKDRGGCLRDEDTDLPRTPACAAFSSHERSLSGKAVAG
jgi:hypothetical protein